MNRELPFDSIESAHQIVALLAKVVLETKRGAHACNLEAADAVPWYTSRTSNLSTKEKSREMSQTFAQQR